MPHTSILTRTLHNSLALDFMKIKKLVAASLLPLNILLFFLLVFSSRLVVPSWLQVIGRMHPLVLHFPIVLVLLYVAWQLFASEQLKSHHWYKEVTEILLLVAALTAAVTALMGLFLSREAGYDSDAIAWHKWLGASTSFVLFAFYSFRLKIEGGGLFSYASALSIAVLIAIASHLGANITHGENFVLAPVTPDKKRQVAALEDAVVYADLVQPILESKCMGCHNSSKAKGELVMDTKELLLKGGKNGKLWDSGRADLGLMMHRIHLPEEEKEHMPPAGKPQLSIEEMSVLYGWIKGGSLFDKRVIDLPENDTLRILASKVLKQSTDEQYDFAAADEKQIQKLTNNNRIISQVAIGSPALVVNFYNKPFYNTKQLEELKPLENQVVELNLENMGVKDEDLKVISRFKNLRKLNLNFTSVTGKTLGELKNLQFLKSLSLSGTTVKPGDLTSLIALPKLKTVYLWNTSVVSKDAEFLASKNKNISFQTGFKGDTVVLKLTPPIFQNEQPIITAKPLPLDLKQYVNGTTIRYTLDGKDPDSVSSPVYDKNVVLKEDVTVKAKAFKPGWISSDIIQEHFFKTTYVADSAVLVTQPDARYKGAGAKTLIDLDKSDLNGGSGKWLGYRDSTMVAVMMYNNPVDVKNVTISLLRDINGYIFPPMRVEIWGGTNEKDMALLSRLEPKQPEKAQGERENISVSCDFKPTSVKCLKLVLVPVAKLPQWHQGKGSKGWIFVDEVFVN